MRVTERKHGRKAYRYLHLAEAFRDEEGRARQRMIANLGRMDDFKPAAIERLLAGFRRVFGLPEPAHKGANPSPRSSVANLGPLLFESGTITAYNYGGAYAVTRIFEDLGWEEPIRHAARKHRTRFDLLSNIRTLLVNRLLDPSSKLHILEWFKGTFVPGVKRKDVTYPHLLRAMDFLHKNKNELERAFAEKLVSMFDLEVDLVFYDVTSVYFEIDGPDPDEGLSTMRKWGYSRDHRPDRPQVVVGLVMTRSGIPLAHRVFRGNTVDKSTLEDVVKDLADRFGIRRCIFVGDRGMLSDDNLKALRAAKMEFIVAYPLRRNQTVREVLPKAEPKLAARAGEETVVEVLLKDEAKPAAHAEEAAAAAQPGERRFVVAHNEEIAVQTKKNRLERLAEAERFIRALVAKLNRQDAGEVSRGRPATDDGVLIKIHDYLRDQNLLRYTEVYRDENNQVSWRANTEARQWENRIDGKLVLETTNEDLSAEEVVKRYKEL
ncbi:MAG: IS1634 family transposase, partial [Elusimicrobiota bacterium]